MKGKGGGPASSLGPFSYNPRFAFELDCAVCFIEAVVYMTESSVDHFTTDDEENNVHPLNGNNSTVVVD